MRLIKLFPIGLPAILLTFAIQPSENNVPANTQVDSVTPAAPMIEPRSGHSATLLPDGRVLIVGGMRRNQDFYRSAEFYDPQTGKFHAAGELASGELLVAGGSKRVEIYNPRTGKFTVAAGQISDVWHYMSETRLKDGRVLLAGGYANNDKATADAWIFRP